MVTEPVWEAPTVCVTLATLDLTALCLTPLILTSSRRTLKVHRSLVGSLLNESIGSIENVTLWNKSSRY